MRLTRAEREAVRHKFDGRCAYCGDTLGDRWHADHLNPVVRQSVWENGKGFVQTGEVLRPENDTIDNLMPACAACNIDKGAYELEWWRSKLERAIEVLTRNNATYRHARRFGLVAETGERVTFYFEKPR